MSKAALIPECKKDIGGVKEEICVSPNNKKEGELSLFSRLLRLDTLSKRNSLESPSTEPQTTYYAVYIPCEIKKGPDEETIHVYTDKIEALELFRRYKSARFKAFRNHQDAVSFALRGAEPVDTHEGNGNSIMGEKPYPFRAPSPQDMVSLRKAIEAGNATVVRERVWNNPRYLVSSGSTPAILQEGSRYNALHVAAKALNADICNLILTTVGNPAFVQTLYGIDADQDTCKEFATILVDRYLNTPDKAMNETPLHFASKFGAEKVVDVLTSFPQCNKLAKNKYGETAKDIICSRSPCSVSSSRIGLLLSERYYVPVLHSEDGSGAPAIGLPFTPAEHPELNPDPLSPRYEIRAFAGPMPGGEALGFRRRWKTPPRNGFRLNDVAKGLERVGRNLADEMQVGWKEYWPFLDTFTDLRTREGLQLLEEYLKTKYEAARSLAYEESLNRSHCDDLSVSRISLGNLSRGSPTDTVLSPISELCVAMKTCKITDAVTDLRKTDKTRRLCPINRVVANGESPPQTNHTVSQLLCIERTCQVFAKRIADALIFSLTAEPDVAGESLKSEAKHLQHTINTYMGDERFQTIDFTLTHSRLAQLVVFKLRQKTKELDDINNLVEFLIKLRCPNDDIFSSDDERKPFSYRTSRMKNNHVIDGHVRCASSFICEELTESDTTKGPAASNIECLEIWEKASKCRCDWKIESFERNSKKNASFRKNRSILSTSPKSESFIRRLTFDHDIGDGKLHNNETETPWSVNSPAGDNLYTLDVTKCEVVGAEISDDESVVSCQSESDAYETAEYDSHDDHDHDHDMQDASDSALAEPFIHGVHVQAWPRPSSVRLLLDQRIHQEELLHHQEVDQHLPPVISASQSVGEEPTKMDRLVFDAISSCDFTHEQYPNVFRWRHSVALHAPAARERWPATCSLDESVSSAVSAVSVTSEASWRVCHSRCSTPQKERELRDSRDSHADKTLPLQVSSWLRVTGPNSPRAAKATSHAANNVSFGF